MRLQELSLHVLKKVTAERDFAINALAEWALAVDEDSSWEGWSENYKDVRYVESGCRKSMITHLLVDEFNRIESLNSAPFQFECRGCKKEITARTDTKRDYQWCQECVETKKAPKYISIGAENRIGKDD
jgi:hypothetical protein